MQVLSSAKNGAQGIDINFKYEYVDGDTRNSNTSDIKISVPVSQPDRFELGDPVLPDTINAGEESTISMDYVNKGKGDVSNVEASIEGDGITATQATQYIGNVASGVSGSIGFAFTAAAAGEYDAKLKVMYEDANGQQQTKESPVKSRCLRHRPRRSRHGCWPAGKPGHSGLGVDCRCRGCRCCDRHCGRSGCASP